MEGLTQASFKLLCPFAKLECGLSSQYLLFGFDLLVALPLSTTFSLTALFVIPNLEAIRYELQQVENFVVLY